MTETGALRRVAIIVHADEAEPARARLLELVPGGFEERVTDAGVEFAAYGDREFVKRIGAAFGEVTVSLVAAGWEDAWRAFHRPVVAGGVWLGPPWEAPPPGMPAVVIDPGRAFGTGAHATTRLCVELLATLARGSLIDVGCGSGVLALAGARLGFGPLLAVDDDPVAVEVAVANAEANGVALVARVIDARRDALPVADVAAVNIFLPSVEAVLPRLDVATAVTSGYLAHEQPAVPGWRSINRLVLDGWAADVFVRV